ncbi:MAG: hypothetical protein COA94_09295 [Rickettsiales bacterium]|nr:MAG: hypothetical protein COA94_09295 [Rickettsiales bacterium]
MIQKLFNFILVAIFVSLIALFVYKSMYKPEILSVSLDGTKIEKNSGASSTGAQGRSKSELNAIIKEYIINHPEDILKSLEGMQKKKILELTKKSTEYLKANNSAIENADSPPVIGNLEGDISIVVFYDYNCSFCQKANIHTNNLIESDAGIKVILRPIPILGGSSMYVAKVMLAVQRISPAKFLAIHNDLMKMKLINKDSVKSLISKYEIDYSLVDNEVNSYSIRQQINKNFEFAKGLGIKGAPSHVINGKFIPGMLTLDKLKSIVKHIRAAKK